MTPTRRSVLRVGCGVLAGGMLAGCVGGTSSNGSDNDASTDTESGTSPSGSASSTETAARTETERPTTIEDETGQSTTTSEMTETRGTATGIMMPGTTDVNRGCNGARGLEFKPRNGMIRWDRRSVLVSYGLGPGAHVHFVVYEGDTVLGTTEFDAPNVNTVTDLQAIPLEKPLTGKHTIRVVMYTESDGNEKFEPENATPCRYEGEVIQAGPETIDFSEFATTTATAG